MTKLSKILRAAVVCVLTLIASSQVQPAFAQAPPYEQKLLRLAEVLGSVHFLRNLCGEAGTGWRDSMGELLVSEKPTPERKALMTASFNHGYRSFDGTYLRCTNAAIDALDRYMEEGALLSEEIATRFGN